MDKLQRDTELKSQWWFYTHNYSKLIGLQKLQNSHRKCEEQSIKSLKDAYRNLQVRNRDYVTNLLGHKQISVNCKVNCILQFCIGHIFLNHNVIKFKIDYKKI